MLTISISYGQTSQKYENDLTDIKVSLAEIKGEMKSMQSESRGEMKGMQKQLDGMQKQIDDMRTLIYIVLTSIIGLVGYITWDRKTALNPLSKRLSEIEETEKTLLDFIKEMSKDNPKYLNIAHKLERQSFLSCQS